VAIVSVKELLKTGIHFGHRTSRWNPKMKKYIYGKRNHIHIINILETVRGLVKAGMFLNKLAANGRKILFVGTKKQAQELVKTAAEACSMPYVDERWLGGTLTNLSTIRQRVARLEELEGYDRDGSMAQFSKKIISSLRREREKVFSNLNGIRAMTEIPGALVIVDPRKEKNAIAEAVRLRVPVVALTDTDCDPDLIDIVVPGNDDAIRAIAIVMETLSKNIRDGVAAYTEGRMEMLKNLPQKVETDIREQQGRGKPGRGDRGDRRPPRRDNRDSRDNRQSR
jgi:small subunit ribosomal protein S2